MNTYPKYKPSGVEWIGEIPQNWNISRVKAAFYRKKEKAYRENPTILSLTSRGIVERDISHNEGQIAESYFEYNPVDVGDLLLNPMDLVTNAFASVSKLRGVISPAYFNLVHKDKINSKYFEYYFKLQYWNKSFFAHGKGVSIEHRWTLNQETLMNFPIPLPNDEEQNAIANFLDEKTAKIDSLIEKKKQLIELLKEERTAIINQAVTKGINPDVKLKPSGIDWLGDIPEHWEVKKLKYVLRIKSGDGIKSEEIDFDGNYPVYGGNGIMGYTENYNSDSLEIIIGRVGAKCGNVRLVAGKKWISDNALVVELMNGFDYKFITILLESVNLNILANQNAQPLITSTLVRNKIVPIPKNIEEQHLILQHIESNINTIDNSISKIEKEIELLQEYRTALISEVVTGKIKVV